MRVGPLDIQPPVLLAPMAAVTDLPFRTVVEEFGIGLTITEFLSANAIDAGDPRTIGKMTPSLEGRPFGVQIFGREFDSMQKAARLAVDIGASLVDINMGCPAKRVVAGACGSALMKEPELAMELTRAVVEVVPATVPVTVKHRAGWDGQHRNAPEFACQLVEAGAKMITVHGRTRTQGFSGSSCHEIIRLVREAVPEHIPVIGNGDVTSVDDYFHLRECTGCDGVMIGRGALGNPWLFRSIGERLAGRPDPGPPCIEERQRVFERHLTLMRELKAGPKLLHEVRKACAWYAKGLRGANAVRKRVWSTDDPDECVALVSSHFVSLRDQAAA